MNLKKRVTKLLKYLVFQLKKEYFDVTPMS